MSATVWYNLSEMNRILATLWMFALVALVAFLPPLGPLFDHHFAERMPYHTHVGATNEHEHGYRQIHSHDAPDWNPALYELDAASVVLAIALSTDSDAAPASDSDSALRIPGPGADVLISAYISPPDTPPRRALPPVILS